MAAKRKNNPTTGWAFLGSEIFLHMRVKFNFRPWRKQDASVKLGLDIIKNIMINISMAAILVSRVIVRNERALSGGRLSIYLKAWNSIESNPLGTRTRRSVQKSPVGILLACSELNSYLAFVGAASLPRQYAARRGADSSWSLSQRSCMSIFVSLSTDLSFFDRFWLSRWYIWIKTWLEVQPVTSVVSMSLHVALRPSEVEKTPTTSSVMIRSKSKIRSSVVKCRYPLSLFAAFFSRLIRSLMAFGKVSSCFSKSLNATLSSNILVMSWNAVIPGRTSLPRMV